jgi:hypothetical protein
LREIRRNLASTSFANSGNWSALQRCRGWNIPSLFAVAAQWGAIGQT